MREICTRCTRPKRGCVCHGFPEEPKRSKISILVVQSAAEAKCKTGTAWLIPHVLANCTILPSRSHSNKLSTLENAVLLFPSHTSVPITNYTCKEDVKTVVIIDGTWKSAKRILTSSKILSSLPKVSITAASNTTPTSPLFRIRRPPSDILGAVSTAEAAAIAIHVLESTENGTEICQAIRKAVSTFSQVQINFIRQGNIETGVPHRTERRGYVQGLYEEQANNLSTAASNGSSE